MTFEFQNFGDMSKLLNFANDIIGMNQKDINIAKMGFQTDFIHLEKTPEEALRRARLESLKKGLPFKEPNVNIDDEERNKMVRKLMEDIIENSMRKNA